MNSIKPSNFLLILFFALPFLSCNHSVKKEYYSDGHLKAEIPYNDKGQAIGWVKVYYRNGNLKGKTYYVNGKKDSISFGYYKTGELKYKVSYNEGKEDGPAIFYYRNGQKKSEVTYENGKKTGKFHGYDKQGHWIEVAGYKNDSIISHRKIDKFGRLEGEIGYPIEIRVIFLYGDSSTNTVDTIQLGKSYKVEIMYPFPRNAGKVTTWIADKHSLPQDTNYVKMEKNKFGTIFYNLTAESLGKHSIPGYVKFIENQEGKEYIPDDKRMYKYKFRIDYFVQDSLPQLVQ